MIKIINEFEEQSPNIKEGNFLSATYHTNEKEEEHILYVFYSDKNGCLNLVSLNHYCSVWNNIDNWWPRGGNFTNIKILPKGTKFQLS